MTAALMRQGWQARLELEYQLRGDRTRLTASRREGPLSVQRAFYPEVPVCHSYLLHPPGGVVAGDQLDIRLRIASRAQTLVTTPGATKFYRSSGAQARVQQHLRVAADASLEWLPLENIFFPGTQTQIDTRVDLEANARFIGWEISCLGRPANAERFVRGEILSHLKIYRDEQPLLLERFATRGLDLVDSAVGMRGDSAQATLVATGATNELLDRVQQIVAVASDNTRVIERHNDLLCGATLVDDLLVVRVLGDQSMKILALLSRVWREIRPSLLGREAIPPRIWST